MRDAPQPAMMAITPLTPAFCAEVTGLDLAEPLDAGTLARVTEAIDAFAVLVFRDQAITDEQQIAFSQNFGPLETTRRAHRPDYKQRLDKRLSDISNLDEKNEMLKSGDYRLMSSLANRLWHTDSTFKRIPARYSILAAHNLPKAGGETELADMRAAYDGLDEKTRERIDGYVCEHSIFNSRAVIGFTDFTDEERAALPPVPQVLVRTHPATGRKNLYLASHASHVVGLPVPEGKMLLMDLMEHATRREYVYSHTWRTGDVVMWDDRCTMHRGRYYDPAEVRDMRRTTVSDEVPTVSDEMLAAAGAA